MLVYLDVSILTGSSKPLNIKWTELKKKEQAELNYNYMCTQTIIKCKPFELIIHFHENYYDDILYFFLKKKFEDIQTCTSRILSACPWNVDAALFFRKSCEIMSLRDS